MVGPELPKLKTRVRFPVGASINRMFIRGKSTNPVDTMRTTERQTARPLQAPPRDFIDANSAVSTGSAKGTLKPRINDKGVIAAWNGIKDLTRYERWPPAQERPLGDIETLIR